jgi:hypothetical protein
LALGGRDVVGVADNGVEEAFLSADLSFVLGDTSSFSLLSTTSALIYARMMHNFSLNTIFRARKLTSKVANSTTNSCVIPVHMITHPIYTVVFQKNSPLRLVPD